MMVDVVVIEGSELSDPLKRGLEMILRCSPRTSAAAICELIEQLDYNMPDDRFWQTAGSIALSIYPEDALRAFRQEAKRILDESYESIPERTRLFYRALE